MTVKEKYGSSTTLKTKNGDVHIRVNPPMLVVGNIFIGQQWVAPQGKAKIENTDTGEVAHLEYKERGAWSTREEDINFLSGSVFDKNGVEKYKFYGKFTDEIRARNLETGQEEIIARSTKILPTQQDPKKIYGLTTLALQMNNITPKLKAKLPPTDSRLRPDIRAWEEAQLDLATKEKDRLEENQRKRRKAIKEELQLKLDNKEIESFDIADERTFYRPQYFVKKPYKDENGKDDVMFESNADAYW